MAKRKSGKKSRRDVMGNNRVYRYIFIPCAIVVITSLIYLIWFINTKNSTYDNIAYIKSFMTSSGVINDFQNKLGMHDPMNDIRWYKTDNEIRIEFGRIYLTWEPKDFYKQENLDLLGSIGFSVEVKKNEEGVNVLHLYYAGEELPRWVK